MHKGKINNQKRNVQETLSEYEKIRIKREIELHAIFNIEIDSDINNPIKL